MMARIAWGVFAVLFVLLIAGLCCFKFYIWRLQHPQAPTWTYFFK